ncbi:MAG: hypothetical protein PGN25_05795 [Methylorubrum populi]
MSLLGELTYALISTSDRSIGGIIPDVVLEENHRDSLLITKHPVEAGAAITDHAFLLPAEVEMRCGFSNSSHGDPGYARAVYDALRRIQASRRPFTVFSGKRRYKDMLIADLGVTTEARTENVLAVAVRLQQIIIVSTKTAGAGTSTAGVGASQASPESTGSVQNSGEKRAAEIGDQSFAGAANPNFNPGAFSADGGTLGNGSFGLDGISSSINIPEDFMSAPRTTAPATSGTDNFWGGP